MAPRSNRREAILRAAVRVLRTAGTSRFSQNHVAREAGMPQGHLTYYFPKKIDMVRALTQRFRQATLRRLQARLQDTAHEDRFDTLLDFSRELILDTARTRMMLALILETDASDALRPLLEQDAQAIRATFSEAMGLKPGDVDADLVLALIWGLGLQQFVFGDNDAQRVDSVLARIREMFDAVDTPPPALPSASIDSTG